MGGGSPFEVQCRSAPVQGPPAHSLEKTSGHSRLFGVLARIKLVGRVRVTRALNRWVGAPIDSFTGRAHPRLGSSWYYSSDGLAHSPVRLTGATAQLLRCPIRRPNLWTKHNTGANTAASHLYNTEVLLKYRSVQQRVSSRDERVLSYPYFSVVDPVLKRRLHVAGCESGGTQPHDERPADAYPAGSGITAPAAPEPLDTTNTTLLNIFVSTTQNRT